MPATGTLFVGEKGAISGDNDWARAFKGGAASPGNFLDAANCSEAIAPAGAAPLGGWGRPGSPSPKSNVFRAVRPVRPECAGQARAICDISIQA
jgi:hypothetical protein